MDKKHFYREIIWECGCYTAVSIFPVYKRPGVRRSKCKPTSEIQKFLNDKHSREHLKRLVHLNFTKDDYFIGLDYMQSCLPNDDAVAKRDVQNWLRRIKRLYQRYGGELKYIMAYERAERGRPHFHVIINNIGVPEKLIRDKWTFGRTDMDPLQFDENGVVGLSMYISKNDLFSKRWCASKNLIQPRPKTRDYSYSRKMVEAVRIEDHSVIQKQYGENAHVISCEVTNNQVNRADYIYLEMFDYERFIKITGQQRYERKIKKDKTPSRTPARE